MRIYPTRNRERIILEVRPDLLYLSMYLANAMENEISLKHRNCLSEILSSEIRSYFILGVTCTLYEKRIAKRAIHNEFED